MRNVLSTFLKIRLVFLRKKYRLQSAYFCFVWEYKVSVDRNKIFVKICSWGHGEILYLKLVDKYLIMKINAVCIAFAR